MSARRGKWWSHRLTRFMAQPGCVRRRSVVNSLTGLTGFGGLAFSPSPSALQPVRARDWSLSGASRCPRPWVQRWRACKPARSSPVVRYITIEKPHDDMEVWCYYGPLWCGNADRTQQTPVSPAGQWGIACYAINNHYEVPLLLLLQYYLLDFSKL